MSDASNSTERDAVYRVVRDYVEKKAPERVGELERVFGAVYRAAEIRSAAIPTEGAPGDGEGLPFDSSLLAGTLVSEATWIAFNLVRAMIGRMGLERRAAFERSLQAEIGHREMVAELERALYDLRTVRGLLGDIESSGAESGLPDTTPDLTILVSQDVADAKPSLSYELKAADPALDLNYTPFGPVVLELPPRALFDELYKDIERLARAPGDPERASRMLEGIATQLAIRLLPGPLRERLWRLRGRVESVVIFSDEPWIPWELLALRDPTGKGPGELFGEAFALTRWLRGVQETVHLSLSELALVAPGDTGLPGVGAEAKLVEALAREGRSVTRIRPRYVELTDALESGRFDAWHFCGHGLGNGIDPDGWPIVLEGNDELTARDLSRLSPAFRERRPLVFLNSCHSGRTAEALTGIGGLAPACLRTQAGPEPAAAAGAFVGAYWSIPDDAARRFAECFYRELLADAPVGEAARRARRQLAEDLPGDPARAAYTVFAHPRARL